MSGISPTQFAQTYNIAGETYAVDIANSSPQRKQAYEEGGARGLQRQLEKEQGKPTDSPNTRSSETANRSAPEQKTATVASGAPSTNASAPANGSATQVSKEVYSPAEKQAAINVLSQFGIKVDAGIDDQKLLVAVAKADQASPNFSAALGQALAGSGKNMGLKSLDGKTNPPSAAGATTTSTANQTDTAQAAKGGITSEVRDQFVTTVMRILNSGEGNAMNQLAAKIAQDPKTGQNRNADAFKLLTDSKLVTPSNVAYLQSRVSDSSATDFTKAALNNLIGSAASSAQLAPAP